MANIIFKRGTSNKLQTEPLEDGKLSFTTDDGKIHMDFVENGELKRKTFYGGKLTFGSYVYDGTEDVNVKIYEGDVT